MNTETGRAKIKLEQGSKNQVNNTAVKTKDKVKLRLLQIVEFADGGTYNGTQNVVSSYDFANHSWAAFNMTNTTLGNTTVYRFETSTNDNVFSFAASMSTGVGETANAILTPTSVKIDFVIGSSFSFQGNSTQLALCLSLRSKSTQKVELEHESIEARRGFSKSKEGAVNLGGAFFSWTETVTCGSNGTANVTLAHVNITTAEGSGNNSSNSDSDDDASDNVTPFCFTFDSCHDTVSWDPKVGSTPNAFMTTSTSGATSVADVAKAIMFVLMSAMLLLLSRD